MESLRASSVPAVKAEQISRQRLGKRFDDSLVYATHVHGAQTRKETEIPYIAHLLAVAALVIEDGGSEDEAIAALLHDAVEDQGGAARLADIRHRFGDAAADIVAASSDTDVLPKPPWRERKEAYIAHLVQAGPQVIRVSLADKLHNARAILGDYRRLGDGLWGRFHSDSDQLWYYRALVEAFRRVTTSPMIDELDRVVTELEGLATPSRKQAG
jgi:(p)ppGpp synthase/HD superfamily hydrolase